LKNSYNQVRAITCCFIWNSKLNGSLQEGQTWENCNLRISIFKIENVIACLPDVQSSSNFLYYTMPCVNFRYLSLNRRKYHRVMRPFWQVHIHPSWKGSPFLALRVLNDSKMTRSSSESDHIMFRRTNQHCAESTSVHFCPLCKNSPFFRLPGRFALLLENVFSASFTLKQFCRCRLGPIYVEPVEEEREK